MNVIETEQVLNGIVRRKTEQIRQEYPREFEKREITRGRRKGQTKTVRPREEAWRAFKAEMLAAQLGEDRPEGYGVTQLEPGTHKALAEYARVVVEGLAMVPAMELDTWPEICRARQGLPRDTIVLDTSQTGAGKTTQHVRAYVREMQAQGYTIVYVTHRQALATKMAEESRKWPECKPLACYEGQPADWQARHATEEVAEADGTVTGGLAICSPSLRNIRRACREHAGKVAFIVDEVGAVLDEATRSTQTLPGHDGGTYDAGLGTLVAMAQVLEDRSTPALCLDATAGQVHAWMLEQMTGRKVRVLRKVRDGRPQGRPGMPVSIRLAKASKAGRQQIITDCVREIVKRYRNGQRVFLACDDKRVLCAVVTALAGEGIPRSEMEAWGRFTDKGQQAQLAGCGVRDTVEDVPEGKVVAYTSLVSVGVSFMGTGGALAGALTVTGLGEPAWILQALGRPREAVEAMAWGTLEPLVPGEDPESVPDIGRGRPPEKFNGTVEETRALAQTYLKRKTEARQLLRWTLPDLLAWNGYTMGKVGPVQANDGDMVNLSGKDYTAEAEALLAVEPWPKKDQNMSRARRAITRRKGRRIGELSRQQREKLAALPRAQAEIERAKMLKRQQRQIERDREAAAREAEAEKEEAEILKRRFEARRLRTWAGHEDVTLEEARLWCKLPPEGRAAVMAALGRSMPPADDDAIVGSRRAKAVAKALRPMLEAVWVGDMRALCNASRGYWNRREAQDAASMGIAQRDRVNMDLRGQSVGGAMQWLVKLGFTTSTSKYGQVIVQWPEHFPEWGAGIAQRLGHKAQQEMEAFPRAA